MTRRRRTPPYLRPSIVALTLGVITVGVVPAAAAFGAPAAVTRADATAAPKVYGPFAVATTGAAASTTATPVASSNQAVSPVAFVTTTAPPGSAAAKAIEFALAQRGLPYVWGGDGPRNGDAGFDCSGLTTAAYAYAGITLPRTAHTQYYAGPHVPDGAELQPGDLVFYGVPARVHHVGLYIGGGRMVNAPTFGEPVQLAYVRYKGDDYLGATRPAAGKDATGLIPTDKLPVAVPPTPSPDAPQGPSDFPAPAAPDPAPDRAQGPATPQQLQAAAEGSPDQQQDVASTPIPGGAPTPPVTSTPVGPPPVTPPPATTPPVTTPPVTTPPVTTPPATTAPVTPPPVSTPPVTTPPVTTPPVTTPPVTTPPGTSTPPVTAPPTTRPPTTPPTTPPPATTTPPVTTAPVPKAPTGLVLPGGTLTLVRAAADADGLPAAPASASRGSLGWYPGTDGSWTAAVSLNPGVATGSVKAGATVVVTGPGGARTTLTVTSVRTTDAATAKALSRTIGTGPRVVLLQTDPATGRVLVITAT